MPINLVIDGPPEPSARRQLVRGNYFRVLVVSAATAWRAGPSPARRTAATSSLPRRLLPRPSAWALAGSTFALSTGDQRRAVPARAALVGAD